MAEAQVRVLYRSKGAAALFAGLVVLVPVAALFTLLTLVFTLVSTTTSMFGPALVIQAGAILSLLSVCAGLIIVTDKTVFLTREGISLPFLLYPSISRRTELPWHTLKSIQFLADDPAGRLVLFFDNRRRVSISLDRLLPAERENLLHAIDIWANAAERFPQLEDARTHLGIGMKSGGSGIFTEFWEEELTRRFAATNFVPLEPGRKIESQGLKVIRQLAFGGLSAIYLVAKEGERRHLVLKESVIPPDAAREQTEKAAELFRREAALLAKLSHPQIAVVHDHFVIEERHYLLLEHIAGMDMRRLIKERGPQTEKIVIGWAIELADILAYLHGIAPPVVHRDLTPENIIVKEDNHLTVIDFGAANVFLGTATGTMIGKQAYIAPEQLRGKATPSSDLYALGATMYFLLTGQDPIPLSSSRPRKVSSLVSPEVDDLVGRLTALDADRRFDSAQAVSQHLHKLCLMTEPKR